MKVLRTDFDGFWETDWERDEALILAEGKWYDGYDHQSAMMEYMEDFWSKKGLDLENDKDFGKACGHTDLLFREGKLYGFDLMEGNDGKTYLISHYRNITQNADAMKCVLQYVKEHGVIFGYYTDNEKLGDKCELVDLAA